MALLFALPDWLAEIEPLNFVNVMSPAFGRSIDEFVDGRDLIKAAGNLGNKVEPFVIGLRV